MNLWRCGPLPLPSLWIEFVVMMMVMRLDSRRVDGLALSLTQWRFCILSFFRELQNFLMSFYKMVSQ
jgi:hypothetical protein